VGVAGRVLVDGDEAGDAAAFSEYLAHAMAGGLGRSETYVNVFCGEDGLEVDVESVREEQERAGLEVGRDLFGI